MSATDHSALEAVPVAISRRSVVVGLGFLPLLRLLPRSTIEAAFSQAQAEFRFFDAHEAAVVTEATARLIPGPDDDPTEVGHPGAREAGVVYYIDLFLSAFADDPPRIYATGPWSGRHGGAPEMDAFIPLTAWQEAVWRERIIDLQDQYRAGIAALDEKAGGDFAVAGPETQDLILVDLGPDGFRRVLFEHAIEGTYAAPEYGGNRELSGWLDIDYLGDVAPNGYTAEETGAEVPDVVAADVTLPFPPDMATTGTDDPLGGETLTPSMSRTGRSAFDQLVSDREAWFAAAEPGIGRARPAHKRSRR